eukprot:746276-Hanusia_phi.AAC.3
MVNPISHGSAEGTAGSAAGLPGRRAAVTHSPTAVPPVTVTTQPECRAVPGAGLSTPGLGVP